MEIVAPKLAGAAILAAFTVVTWIGFVRTGPEYSGLATILTKGYMAGRSYTQIPIGDNRGFRTPNQIAIADANTFELKLDDRPETVRASFNTVKSRQFEVGQRVRIQYLKRGLPPLWLRITVTEMTPADAR